MNEIKRAKRLSQALWRLLEQILPHRFVPNTSISKQSANILRTILPPFPIRPAWNCGRPSKELRLCTIVLSFYSEVHNIFQRTFSHDLQNSTNSMVNCAVVRWCNRRVSWILMWCGVECRFVLVDCLFVRLCLLTWHRQGANATQLSPNACPFAAVGKHSTIAPNAMFGPLSGSPNRQVFSHLPGGLRHFTDDNDIPWNQPTTFRPSRIATVPQTPFRFFFVLISQKCHSSQNGEALMFNDSRVDLHKFCTIPRNCQCKCLSAWLEKLFLIPEEIWFCTRCDCNHCAATENFSICCHQVTTIFCSKCCITEDGPFFPAFSCGVMHRRNHHLAYASVKTDPRQEVRLCVSRNSLMRVHHCGTTPPRRNHNTPTRRRTTTPRNHTTPAAGGTTPPRRPAEPHHPTPRRSEEPPPPLLGNHNPFSSPSSLPSLGNHLQTTSGNSPPRGTTPRPPLQRTTPPPLPPPGKLSSGNLLLLQPLLLRRTPFPPSGTQEPSLHLQDTWNPEPQILNVRRLLDRMLSQIGPFFGTNVEPIPNIFWTHVGPNSFILGAALWHTHKRGSALTHTKFTRRRTLHCVLVTIFWALPSRLGFQRFQILK